MNQVEVYVRVNGELLPLGAVPVEGDPRSAAVIASALRVVADRLQLWAEVRRDIRGIA